MTVTVTAAQAGRTVRQLLKQDLAVSTALINRLKRREGALLLNGRPVFTNAPLRAGDTLYVDLTDPAGAGSIPPIPMALDIRYEDGALLVLNKPAPLAVHPSSFAPEEPTLANGLAHYLGPASTFHPVNRLDRGTTGLMAAAKSRYVHNLLRRQLHTAGFYREYRAVAVGTPCPPAGRIDLPIARAEGSAIRRRVSPGGAAALTEYETLCSRGGLTLLRLIPHTGRTHQLRVHMAAIGCPLLGDWLYGTETDLGRPALHACLLRLRHPLTGETLCLTADLPEDMARCFPDLRRIEPPPFEAGDIENHPVGEIPPPAGITVPTRGKGA